MASIYASLPSKTSLAVDVTVHVDCSACAIESTRRGGVADANLVILLPRSLRLGHVCALGTGGIDDIFRCDLRMRSAQVGS